MKKIPPDALPDGNRGRLSLFAVCFFEELFGVYDEPVVVGPADLLRRVADDHPEADLPAVDGGDFRLGGDG